MNGDQTRQSQILHASCVTAGGRGLLILGPSGAGKSALALQLIALGAQLVSDDQTELTVAGGVLLARPPTALRGLIEARGMGILHCPFAEETPVHLVADLASIETDRLPPPRKVTLLGVSCDLVHLSHGGHFPAAMMCYLLYGRFA